VKRRKCKKSGRKRGRRKDWERGDKGVKVTIYCEA
jgi:hypothetical protein